MKLTIITLLTLLSLVSSCNGKDTLEGTARAVSFPDSNTPADTIPGDNVAALGSSIMIFYQAKDGQYWFGGDTDGVYRYDGETITHYPVKEGSRNILLYSVYIDHAGSLWLGTHDAGEYAFNGKEFVKFQA